MPSNSPKKISVLAAPPGNTSNAKPRPRTERNPDPHALENQRVTITPRSDVEEFRDSVNRTTKSALDAVNNYNRQPVNVRTTTPQGFKPDLTRVGAGMGVGPAFAPEALQAQAGPAFAAEAIPPAPVAPAGAAAGAGAGQVQAALRQALMPQAQASVQQPYRESDGPRRFAVPAARPAAPAAQALMSRTTSTGYSAGVLADRERRKAMAEADSLGLDPATRAVIQQRIQQGDTGAVAEAAAMMTQVGGRAGDTRIQAAMREQLMGGQGAQAYATRQQDQRDRYRAASDRNTAKAQAKSAGVDYGMVNDKQVAFGAGVEKMGLGASAPADKVQQTMRAALGLADSASLRKMAAEDPTNPLVRQALTQATERERKHAANEAAKQTKLTEQERQRKSDDERLKFERDYSLKDLETRGKTGTKGQMDANTEKQMGEAYRDYMRTMPSEPMSRDEFRRVYWDGYSPGVMGRLEEGATNFMNGLANVAGAPLRAAASIGQGAHAAPGDSRYPQGLQQPQAAPSASPYVRPDQEQQLRQLTPEAVGALRQLVAQGGPDAEEAQHILDARASLGLQ